MGRNVEGGTARGALCEARGRRAEMSAGLLALAPVWPPVVGYQDRKCRVSAQPSLVHFPTYDPLPSHPWRGNVGGFASDTSDRSSSHRVFCFHPSPNLTDYGASRAASRNYPATRYCQDGVVSGYRGTRCLRPAVQRGRTCKVPRPSWELEDPAAESDSRAGAVSGLIPWGLLAWSMS